MDGREIIETQKDEEPAPVPFSLVLNAEGGSSIRSPTLPRSCFKTVFWPNLGVGVLFQLLEILEYVCGLKRGPALTLNQNPSFETASEAPKF